MAFNWKTFQTRTLTAIVFAAVMLVGLLWNHWSFLVLFSVIHFGCWWEYLKLTEKIYHTSFHFYLKLGLMLIGYGLMLWFCGHQYELLGYGIRHSISLPVSIAGFILSLIGIYESKKVQPQGFAAAGLGILYISLSWGLMLNLYSRALDVHIHDTLFVFGIGLFPILIIACIWVNDTMAYIVGSFIGKTPLSKISPKKTWEGTVGGILLAVVIVMLVFPAINNNYLYGPMMFLSGSIALISSIFGTFGDLLESKLKRMAEVKDSGSIMPGHGGFLDRFDSLLLAVPAVWLYVKLFI